MTLPTGTISMSQVNTELGLSSTTTISLNQTNVRTLAGVPSGTISMSNLQGKSNAPTPQFNNAFNFQFGVLTQSSPASSVSFDFVSNGTIAYSYSGAIYSVDPQEGPTAYCTPTGSGSGNGLEIQIVTNYWDASGSYNYSFAGVNYTATASTPWYALSSTRSISVNMVGGSTNYRALLNGTVYIRRISDGGGLISRSFYLYSYWYDY